MLARYSSAVIVDANRRFTLRFTGAPETGFSARIGTFTGRRKLRRAPGSVERGTVGGAFINERRHAHGAVVALKTRGVVPAALVSKTSTEDSIPVLVADGVCDDRPVVIERGDKRLAGGTPC